MSNLCFCTEKHEIMTLVDNHVQLRDVLGRLGKWMTTVAGVSVKVVNNELRIQRVDTGSLQKGSQSVRL